MTKNDTTLADLEEEVINCHIEYVKASNGSTYESECLAYLKAAVKVRDDCLAGKQSWFDDFGDIENNDMFKASAVQVGGDHYKDQGLQPFEITYANFGYAGIRASCYTKVNKYLVRDKNDHRENVEKAIHVLQIQLEYYDKFVKEQE